MACAGFAFTVLLGFVILPEGLRQVVVRRPVRAGRPDRLHRLGGQPVARRPHHPADRQRERRPSPAWIVAAVRGRRGRGDLRRRCSTARATHARAAHGGADRAAGLADQLGSPLGVDRAGRWSWPRTTRCRPGGGAPGRTAWACGMLAVAIVAWFGAWPTKLFHVHAAQPRQRTRSACCGSRRTPTRSGTSGTETSRWFPEYHWHGLALSRATPTSWPGWRLFGLLLAVSLLLPTAGKDHDDEPGRDPAGQRGQQRLPAA